MRYPVIIGNADTSIFEPELRSGNTIPGGVSRISRECAIARQVRCLVAGTLLILLLASCATNARQTVRAAPVSTDLKEANSPRHTAEERAALYLEAAAAAAPELGSGLKDNPARETYNQAATDLTVLLRSAEGGRLWNHPVNVTAGSINYHLQFKAASPGVWAPEYFTSFVPASAIAEKRIHKSNYVDGVGGALVGVRDVTPRESFAPPAGLTAPVTATIEFEGRNATLLLRRPAKQPRARVAGLERPLAANYSAPLLYFRHVNEFWAGLLGALFVSHFSGETGLYFLQPYDPARIPVIFVHGLISTPQMWLNVINEIETDPKLRQRYQFWVFAYPTGNPILYSALRFRQSLEKVQQLYPTHKGFVIIGHSLGGLLSQAQVTTIRGSNWDQTMGKPAADVLSHLSPASPLGRALLFKANPQIKRVVFICTPHRGTKMAISALGEIGMRLISLPRGIVSVVKASLEKDLPAVSGFIEHPNVVTGLAPTNPTLKVMDTVPVQAPYHSIIGNRGKPGPLIDSSDGIVPYWSSHMAHAQSELIVPGPHGSCELPQTIAELKRILRLQAAGSEAEPREQELAALKQ